MKLNNTADLVNALKIQQGISLNETGYTLLWIKKVDLPAFGCVLDHHSVKSS